MRKMSRHYGGRVPITCWFVGFGGIGVGTQMVLLFLAPHLSQMELSHVYIVNLCSYCGLLALLAWSLFRRQLQFPAAQPQISHSHDMADAALRSERLAVSAPYAVLQNARSAKLSAATTIQQLKRAVETMQLGVTITNMNGIIVYTNPAEADLHGYTVDELLGADLGILAPAELRNPMTIENIKQIRHVRESMNIRKDGTRFPVRLMSDVLRDQQGASVAVVTTCEDITEQKRLDQIMKQRTHELTLLNRMSDRLQACHDEAETYQVIGDICQQLFPDDSGCLCVMDAIEPHLKVVEFWGTPPDYALVPPREDTEKSPQVEAPPNNLCPYQHVCSDQDCLCVPISVSGEILGLLSLCFNTERHETPAEPHRHHPKEKQSLLHRIADHYALALINLRLRETLRMESIRDPLTGLFNRRYMEESLVREARRAKRHAASIGIIMLDIDHFKPLNDVYGHDAGDTVLQELGLFLQRNTRGEDIACRYGGEEFLLILPEAPLEIATQRGHELLRGIRDLKIVYHGQPLHITASVGVALFPHHSSNVRDVVKSADLAMYRAKRRGRDRIMVAQADMKNEDV